MCSKRRLADLYEPDRTQFYLFLFICRCGGGVRPPNLLPDEILVVLSQQGVVAGADERDQRTRVLSAPGIFFYKLSK